MDLTHLQESCEPFFSWFAKHQLFGIPGDVVAHLVVGATLGAVLLGWLKWGVVRSMIVVMLIGLTKELLFDQHALGLNHLYAEGPKDVFFSD